MSWQRWSLAAALSLGLVFGTSVAVRAVQDESESKPTDSSAERKKELAYGKEAIEAAFKKEVDAQFLQWSITMFADWIEQECGIQAEIDSRSLTDAGFDPEAKVIDIDIRGVTLRSLLHHLLRPLDLTTVSSNGVLLITTPDYAASFLVTEVYPAADLVTFRKPDGSVTKNSEHLVELIATTCDPVTWDAVGGMGTISEFDGMLIISQTEKTHRRIAGVLQAVRSAIDSQKTGDYAPRVASDPITDDGKVRAALAAERRFELKEMPLEHFTRLAQRDKGVPMLIDLRAAGDAGIDVDAVQLTADIANAPLHASLNRVLQPHALTYVVEHEAIVITTPDRASAMHETTIYPVVDLIGGEAVAGENQSQRGDKLAELLTNCVDTATWDHVGGANHVETVEPWSLLVISAPAATQRKIGETLDKLRAAKQQQAESALAPSDATAGEDPIELRVFAIADVTDRNAETAEKIVELVRELLPEVGNNDASVSDSPYVKALPDRIVVRHRQSVLVKVAALLKQLETPQGQAATTASMSR
jgi:hypothetical protein